MIVGRRVALPRSNVKYSGPTRKSRLTIALSSRGCAVARPHRRGARQKPADSTYDWRKIGEHASGTIHAGDIMAVNLKTLNFSPLPEFLLGTATPDHDRPIHNI